MSRGARRVGARAFAVAALLAGCSGERAPTAQVRDGHARFAVLSPTLIRLEYSADDTFEDDPTFNVPRRAAPPPPFTTRVRDGWREIETAQLLLRYRQGAGPFAADNLTLQLRPSGRMIAPWDHPPAGNLGGWLRGLDGLGAAIPLNDGLLTRDGWYLLDDTATALTTRDGWVAPRRPRALAYQDFFLFAYDQDYRRAYGDFVQLTGPPPLLPRWAFGIWFSRYFAYSAADYHDQLLPRFRADAVPLDVLVVDTDWKSPSTWDGWSWNGDRFPDGRAFLDWAAGEGLHVSLNIHPSIERGDPQFAIGGRTGDLPAIGAGSYAWDWGRRDHADAYFALHQPFEDDGVRVWWFDWCCAPGYVTVPSTASDGGAEATSNLVPDSWINELYARRAALRGQRGFAFSRIGASFQGYAQDTATWPGGPWAEHRTTVHFTGDTSPTWEMLAYEIAFTVAEGNIGVPYVTHDLGSFAGGHLPESLYLRWLQFGAFQPLFRLHSNHGDRLPWDYSDATRLIAERFLRLRESLVPYLYTLAREAVDSGVPMARGLYVDFPAAEEAYSAPGEYLLGDALLVAPVTADDGSSSVWLPGGVWRDFFTGERVDGPVTRARTVPLDTMPVFARAGAIVPLQPDMQHVGERPVDPLLLEVFPGADGSFTLYEDAGEGLDYRAGAFTRTPFDYVEADQRLTLGAAAGHYADQPTTRAYRIEIRGAGAPAQVTLDGQPLAPSDGWSYDPTRAALTINLASRPTSRALTLAWR